MSINLDNIKSNKLQKCVYCEINITPENDSGWEAFTEDGITTQPICKLCNFYFDRIAHNKAATLRKKLQ